MKDGRTDVQAAIAAFVRRYNESNSDVFTLYGACVEMPSGRRGNRAELFEALTQARQFLKNLHLKIVAISACEEEGVLGSHFSAIMPFGHQIKGRIRWSSGFDGGLIVRQHDTSGMDE